MMEKVTRLKLHVAKSENTSLSEVEAFEVLSLGIVGKRGLWEVLQEVLPEGEIPGHSWATLFQVLISSVAKQKVGGSKQRARLLYLLYKT